MQKKISQLVYSVFFQLEFDWNTQIGKKMESGTPTMLVRSDGRYARPEGISFETRKTVRTPAGI